MKRWAPAFAFGLCLFGLTAFSPGHAQSVNPKLIGGTVVDKAEWPASPWVGNCSSTLVASNVLLTAAHCVSNGGTKSFTIDEVRYSGRCTHHPAYRGNSTADWALCLLTTAVPADIAPEVIGTEEDAACESGREFLWTGFGCQRWGGRIDGEFRIGTVDAIRCPSRTNYDTVTRGRVALCSGDSGGGGYVTFEDGSRRIVGVNSRSNTTDTSYVSSTYVATFRDWAKNWGEDKDVLICGIHDGAENCRW